MRPFLLALITLFSNATWAAAESIDVKYYGNNWDPANGIMSALLPTANIQQGDGHVRKVPGRDISANLQPGEQANARAGEFDD
jgi:hypothetical protein